MPEVETDLVYAYSTTTPPAEKKVNTTTNMKENEYNDKNAIFAGETQVFVVVLLEFYVHVDVKMLLKTKIGSNPQTTFFK